MFENELIINTTKSIQNHCNPIKILLISHKVNTENQLTSFKLCVIIADSDINNISELEYKLYLSIDSPIPFDLVLYKKSEWDNFKDQIGSFAWKINNTGAIIYG